MWTLKKWVKEQTIVKITFDVSLLDSGSCREQSDCVRTSEGFENLSCLLANNSIVKFGISISCSAFLGKISQ